ncbi:hypothetical protein M413DRAFT_444912 [Hebeloma cylindrosporum]|uniref:Uncharacterized protein n=1 Tax=Hebeloma cylindrosporum TaxID=76867 RepID=A0A0C3BYK1_HEBCY|nr:hypothetical protein M413DRAFT_444912 [Hebeloma cylindrosporum h7]
MSATSQQHGCLDHVFSIFAGRQHPFIILEEDAFRWMGQRVAPREDLDLLIRDSELEGIKTDLLATGRYDLVEQNLAYRLHDPYTQQVPRLRLKPDSSECISLWSESVYMLNVDGEKIEVPDTEAWNVVLMEERFDVDPSWANAASIGYTTRIGDGVKILPPIRCQSADKKYPIYIPTLPRMLDALLDQSRYRIIHPEEFPLSGTNRAKYHLLNFTRYLHLEKPVQRERVLPELAERNRADMVTILNNYKRKPKIPM